MVFGTVSGQVEKTAARGGIKIQIEINLIRLFLNGAWRLPSPDATNVMADNVVSAGNQGVGALMYGRGTVVCARIDAINKLNRILMQT